MGPLSIFVLSTAIGISSTRQPASDTNGAYKALMKATYLQTGMDKKVKRLEKRLVPEELKEYAWVTVIAKIMREKRISFEWKF